MKKLLLILVLSIFAFSSCCHFCRQNCMKVKVVKEPVIPNFTCPPLITGEGKWKLLTTKQTMELNYQALLHNIDLAKRLLDNRNIIIACYQKNFLLYQQKGDEKDEEKVEENNGDENGKD